MKGDKIRANILGVRLIANLSGELNSAFGFDYNIKSVGIITADSDDVLYSALDEATKRSAVEVLYAKSMYAGAGNSTTKLCGEAIGILGAHAPEEIRSGIWTVEKYFETGDCFLSANQDDSINYFAHTVSKSGSYLFKVAGVECGEALAYLVAPPLEAVCGLDAALKAADVRVGVLFSPPSETNYGGGLLTGTQSACKAACAAFSREVENIAEVNKYYE